MKKQLAVTLALALAFTMGCGEHGWEEILFGTSSSSFEGISSSSVDEEEFEYTPSAPPPIDTTPTPPSIANSQGVVIGPLLKTQWGRGTSLFNPFQILPDGNQGWVDCVTISTAQIMKYYNYPSQAIAGETYQGIVFDWANMLDTYRDANVNVTEPQQKAITELVHSMYLALENDRALGSGNNRDFVRNFGYDKTLEIHYRKYYDDATWVAEFTKMIKKQLDDKRPVMAHGTNLAGTSSHGFVIDGYDSKGKFHINWGWGGTADGYYPIDSLSPNGRSLEDGWHHSNDFKIWLNIKPDEGGIGSNEMGLSTFTVEKTSVSQYELFNVNAKIKSFGVFPGGQAGVALVNNNGNIVKYLGVKNFGETSGTRTYNADIYIPDDVKPEQYKLKIVTRLEGGDWKEVTHSDRTANVPSAINFTVNATSGAPIGGYGLAVWEFSSEKNSAIVNESVAVTLNVKNTNEYSFIGGKLGVALIDNDGEIVEVLGTKNINEFGVGGRWINPVTITCKIPGTVSPGQYRLRIVVKTDDNADWHIATMSLNNAPTAIDFTVIVVKQ